MKVGVYNFRNGETTCMEIPITTSQIFEMMFNPSKKKEILSNLSPVEREFLRTGKTRDQQNEDYEKV